MNIVLLRAALTAFAEDAATRLRRLTEAGILPVGMAGRCGSAEVSPHHAALAILALAAPSPTEAPALALRLAGFGLVAVERTHVAEPRPGRRWLETETITLVEVLVAQLAAMRGADPAYQPPAWAIEPDAATWLAPDRPVFLPPPGRQPLARALKLRRPVIIPAAILRAVAAIFPPLPPAPSPVLSSVSAALAGHP